MSFDLRHLHAFVSAAKHRSFTRGARSLNISQPTFTVQIRQLETELGVRLLDRNTRSVQLTRVGRDLAPVVERLLRELTSVLDSTREASLSKSGSVKVAVLPSLAATVLPPIFSCLRKDHPGVTVHLREAPARRIVGLVKSEEVDFGIGWAKDRDSEIQFTPLFRDRLCAIFSAGGKLERKRTVLLRELASLPLILTDRESSVRAMVDDAFAAMGSSVQPVWEVTHMSTALALVRAGLGVTILPGLVLEMDSGLRLRARPVRDPDLVRQIGIIQAAGRSLSPAATVLFRAISAGCREIRAGRAVPGGANCRNVSVASTA
jgi:LysR family transcriptional regulator, carnitine catabolism transcriptional activator